jgi:hypothetical protein
METYQDIQLTKSDAAASLLEGRHILDDDVRQVIYHAETTGEKLFQPEGNRYLAKLTLSNAVFYVEYSVADGSYVVHTAYSHRSKVVPE